MDEFVIMGLVLQEIEYGESDRIIKILTAEKGLISGLRQKQYAADQPPFCSLRPAVLFGICAAARAERR